VIENILEETLKILSGKQ